MKAVPNMQSTARRVTTKNCTLAVKSPMRTYSVSCTSALIAQLEASTSGALFTGRMAAHQGSATQRIWMRLGAAPESRTGDSARICACRDPTVAKTL